MMSGTHKLSKEQIIYSMQMLKSENTSGFCY
jgi:hypothetical protein